MTDVIPVRNIPAAKLDSKRASTSAPGDDSALEMQVRALRDQAAAMNADLKQPAVEGFGDPTDAILWDTRRRLDTLERELAAQSP